MIAKCKFCKKDYRRPVQGGRAFYCSDMCRFNDKIDKTPTCWLWTGNRNSDGYGNILFRGRNQKAHRVSYELFKGEIPNKTEVCHSCDIPSCVNPEHLYLGSHRNNMEDMARKLRRKKKTKLTPKNVIKIRKLLDRGLLSQREIATLFNVSQQLITCINNRTIWKHII